VNHVSRTSESRDALNNGTNEGRAWCYVISNINNNRGQIKIKTISSTHVYSGCDLASVSTADTREAGWLRASH
jgi:hypothetical protein